jgi:hypothetical protein
MKYQTYTTITMMQLGTTVAFAPSRNRHRHPLQEIPKPSSHNKEGRGRDWNWDGDGDGDGGRFRLHATRRDPDPQTSATLFRDYIVESHQEKLKALQTLEREKDAEIAALKEQLLEVHSKTFNVAPPQSQSTSSSSGSGSSSSSSRKSQPSEEELRQKLVSYQKFMTTYLVSAQEDKARAVQEAQTAAIQKYEDQLAACKDAAAQEPIVVESDHVSIPVSTDSSTTLEEEIVKENQTQKSDVSIPTSTDSSTTLEEEILKENQTQESENSQAKDENNEFELPNVVEVEMLSTTESHTIQADDTDLKPKKKSETGQSSIDGTEANVVTVTDAKVADINDADDNEEGMTIRKEMKLEETEDPDVVAGRYLTAISFSVALLGCLEPTQMQTFLQTFALMKTVA